MFFFEVFGPAIKAVEGQFLAGRHLFNWATILQVHSRTSFVAPRFHLKSTVILGYLAWKIWRMEHKYNEWLFIGYRGDLAAYQMKRLKRYIKAIPEFAVLEDMTRAESILHYKYGNYEFKCEPEGIFTANRGRHPNGLIMDDILKDPEVKLDISQLQKIEKLFLEEYEQMPKEECHIVGTPQDEEDIFHRLEQMPNYYSRRWTAVEDYKEKKVLWPEKFSFDKLMLIKESIGDKAFSKEYQCRPVRGAEGYFLAEELDQVIYKRLKNRSIYEEPKLNEYCYGGLDIGKKRHPSHLSIYGKNRKHELVQLISMWMDGVDYKDQVNTCAEVIKNFNVFRLYYDDTRAEFEGFREVGTLPAEMVGVNFTHKKKYEIATKFETKVRTKTIKLLKDARQRRQIINCDNDLKSMETPEGHGDSFWSTALAIDAAQDTGEDIKFL